MRWTYSVEQKMKVAGLLAVIFASIFAVNRLENSRINEMGESMNSVYKDRLVAKNYLFKLSGLLYQKKSMLHKVEASQRSTMLSDLTDGQNRAIKELIHAYGETKLTPEEQTLFEQLEVQIEAINQQESALAALEKSNRAIQAAQLNKTYDAVNVTLNDLSNLQLHIGKSANERAQQILAGSNLLTLFELAVLVVVGLIIHALIFASRSTMTKMKIKPHQLN